RRFGVADGRAGVVYTRTGDGTFFGPFSSASAAYSIAGAVQKAAMLPQCKKQFPRDAGTKPCLNYHIGACIAPCREEITHGEYMLHAAAAKRILRGEIRPLIKELTAQMDKSSEELMFEQAARYRDCIAAVKKLDSQQKIVTAPDVNEDVFGFYADELGSSAVVLMIRSGAVKDRLHWFFHAEEILDSSACSNLIQRYYQQSGFIPPLILCDGLLADDDAKLTEAYLNTLPDARTSILIPEKGDKRKIVDTANENARELLFHERTALSGEREFLLRLTQFLSLEIVPERIEAYDISNNGQNDTTAGMTVIENGRFCKRKYRSFNIKSVENDDCGAMSEAITRRFSHTGQGWELPDLILADGGAGQVNAVKNALSERNIDLPVLGMI
ncbi:MAG TPA: UvrB/UvrC motif-containing protein, partial [Bacillota bacterium]|nr:UvrB/UvrC motif-containing protein [Bacillota bacterium]